MLLHVAAEMIEKLQKEFQEADEQEKDHFLKPSLSLLQTVVGDTEKLL